MKTSKYKYIKVIQQHYGQTWEDVSEYETDSQGNPREMMLEKWASGKVLPTSKKTLLSHDLKEYRLTGYPTRVIRRKHLKTI